MDYYTKELFIPQVDEQDTIVGKVERWKAHKEGILHRGFTVGVLFEGQMLCQHRKHPVFDGFIDLTASSHPIYSGDDLQDMPTAVEMCLQREWNIAPGELAYKPTFAGKVIYDSKHGDYIEHEVCHLYMTEVTKLPVASLEFAYGSSLMPIEKLLKKDELPLLRALAPWVEEFIVKDLLTPAKKG